MEIDESRAAVPAAHRDRELIVQIAALLAADLSLSALFERLCETLAKFVDASVCFVALAQPDGRLILEYLHDHGKIRRTPGIKVDEEGSRSLEVFRTGESIFGGSPDGWVGDAPRFPINEDRPETDDTVSAIFVPMRTPTETIGVLSVQSTHADAYTADDVRLLEACARYLAIAVHNQRLYAALRRTADHDALTDLANHTTAQRTLDRALRMATIATPIAVALFNVTNFLVFNDTFGYAEGDRILRMVADVLRPFGDDRISIGRYGGDEFMMLIEHTSRHEVRGLVEEALQGCRALAYEGPSGPVPVAVSCGYALAPNEALTRNDLVVLAGHRRRLSRQLGGLAVGSEAYHGLDVFGTFDEIRTIVESLLLRDPFLRLHLVHVNALANGWVERLNFAPAERETFVRAALLHDLGKMLIADRILVKPAALTIEEYHDVQRHAEFGEAILLQYPGYEEIAHIVGQHHERFDGTGYPRGLAGAKIHPAARAISVLDAFSAMVLDRPYHRGVSEGEAVAELSRCAGGQFDPEFAASFAQYLGEIARTQSSVAR